MNAQQLKNSILQEAITGRLVPQDPNDEPASVLLDKIRKEKARLVKDGKLKKKDLEETPISEDEKPFKIPKSWEWVRIDQIATSQLGKTLDKGKQTGKEYPYLCSINVYWDGIDLSKVKTFLLKDEELDKYKLKKGDLLVCEGGDYGRCNVWDSDEDMYYQNALHRIRFYGDLSVYFFKYIFEQYRTLDYIVGQGQTIKHFTYANMKTLAFPLPPLAEQKRIVAKIEELLPKVEAYGKAQESLDKLNEELPERLKKSILQEAITGRLVPQDPNDEPASVLLDKIRAEKKQLVKEGKLKKKDLVETPVEEDEKPFEIPESWEWCSLNDICIFLSRGKSPTYSAIPNEYPVFAQKCNLKDGGISLEQAKFLSPETVSKWQEEYHLRTDDVLVNSTGTGTVCRTRLFHEKYLGKYPFTVPDSHVSVVRTSESISSAFIFNLFNSKFYQDYWNDRLAGSTNQKELYIGVLQNTIIPLPPLAEQKRIVAKIEEVFKEIDKLKNNG